MIIEALIKSVQKSGEKALKGKIRKMTDLRKWQNPCNHCGYRDFSWLRGEDLNL